MKQIFIFAILLITACAPVPMQTSKVSPTGTMSATLEVRSTPTPIEVTLAPAETIEASRIQWERVEANREAINNYVFVDTVFNLNKDSAYFKEFGITTKDQLQEILKTNSGYFPASTVKNTHLIFFGSSYEGTFGKSRLSMDKKLKANIDVEIINPDQANNTKIYSGQVHPWFDYMGNEGSPREKSVSVGVGVNVLDDQRQIVLQLVWKDKNYDLFGNRLEPLGVATPIMLEQADFLLRTTLYFGHLIVEPRDFAYFDKVMAEQFYKFGNGEIGKYQVFRLMKDWLRVQNNNPEDIPNFPTQIIQKPHSP